ncbi:hypothetical protein ABZV14_44595 [Streptosporangium canum]|uniref:hypothetical protein n=1 Tax=Streptosporangium canum TaxID=324952 RepID=UPI0033A962EB
MFAARAETERENIRESTLEGLATAARKGKNLSVASIYRALAEYEKQQRYPGAVEEAHADSAALADGVPEPRSANADPATR